MSRARRAQIQHRLAPTQELKFLDTELAATAITTSWTPLNPTAGGSVDTLSVPAVGNGESNRIGRMYTIDSLFIRGVITTGTKESEAAPQADFRARIIVYWDQQTNKAEAAVTDIMDVGGSDDVLAFRDLNNTSRFVVLYDKTFVFRIGPTVTNEGEVNKFAAGSNIRTFSFFKKFPGGVKVQCDGDAADVNVCVNNNFGVGAIVSATQLTPTIAYQARVRFRG